MGLIDNLKSYANTRGLSATSEQLFNSFLEQGFPTTKDEEWKYTSLKKIINSDFKIDEDAAEISTEEINNYSLGFSDKIVFINGNLISKPTIEGVAINAFSENNTASNTTLATLNAALANKGYTITVSPNTIVDQPIEILFFTTAQEDNFQQYRNTISIGKNASIKFVERIQNINSTKCFVNYFTTINAEENSNFEYNKIQNNTENSILIDNLEIKQAANSTCNVNTLIFGGSFTRNNLDFEQNGNNCESNMNGISILDRNQFADNHTFVDHKQAHCQSNEMYKGVYLGASKGVFNGKIMVRPDAQKINAFQANNNLLLSEEATIDSKPQLEIYADDVKCSHGCTIGQLDENALFYMRSRGIAIKEAKAVLTYAFASEALENMTIPQVKEQAQKLIAQKLNVNLDFNL